MRSLSLGASCPRGKFPIKSLFGFLLLSGEYDLDRERPRLGELLLSLLLRFGDGLRLLFGDGLLLLLGDGLLFLGDGLLLLGDTLLRGERDLLLLLLGEGLLLREGETLLLRGLLLVLRGLKLRLLGLGVLLLERPLGEIDLSAELMTVVANKKN